MNLVGHTDASLDVWGQPGNTSTVLTTSKAKAKQPACQHCLAPRNLVGVVNKMAEIMILLQSLSKNGKNSRTPENAFDNADLQSTMLLN